MPTGVESRAARAAVATAALAAALTVAAQATRDGLFLSVLGAESLPLVMMSSATLALVGTMGLSAALGRSAPLRVAPLVFTASALLFALEWFVLERAPTLAAAGLYLHVTGLVPVVVSAFWSVVNERFDPQETRRVMSRMAAAAALGGVAGGLAAERVASLGSLDVLLPGLAAFSLACAVGARAVGATTHSLPHEDAAATQSGVELLIKRPLLRQMATLMLLAAVVETLVEYALKAAATARFDDAAELTRFFALFYTGCGLLAFALNVGVGRRLLRRLGLAASVASLPAAVGIASLVAVFSGGLWGMVGARGAETTLSGAFFRSGFELLYTPVPARLKRRAKAWVDVAAGSAGEIIGAGSVFLLLLWWVDLPLEWVVGLAATGCALELEVVRRIHTSYVGQLADRLKDGRLALNDSDVVDATTAQAVANTRAGLDRESLLARVRAHAAEQLTADPPTSGIDQDTSASEPAPTTAVAEVTPAELEDLTRRVSDLMGGDPAAIKAALRTPWSSEAASRLLRHRLATHAIPLLSQAGVEDDVEEYLRRVAPRVIGQLCDALLADEVPFEAKRRLAGVLADQHDLRALEALLRSLEIADFALRIEVAREAARWQARTNSPPLPQQRIHRLVARELAVEDAAWSSRTSGIAASSGRSVLVPGAGPGDIDRNVEHIFTLLSLAHERRVMASVLTGATSENRGLHGTAREYIESILAPELAAALLARLPAPDGRG